MRCSREMCLRVLRGPIEEAGGLCDACADELVAEAHKQEQLRRIDQRREERVRAAAEALLRSWTVVFWEDRAYRLRAPLVKVKPATEDDPLGLFAGPVYELEAQCWRDTLVGQTVTFEEDGWRALDIVPHDVLRELAVRYLVGASRGADLLIPDGGGTTDGGGPAVTWAAPV